MKILRIVVATVVIVVALLRVVSCYQRGTKLTFNKGDLYYTSAVTEAEAKKLGEYLVKTEMFDGKEKSIQLNKTNGVYEFRAVAKKEFVNDPAMIENFKAIAAQLSANVFNGAKVVVHLCDENFKTVRVVSDK